jgi:hypothetical protein
LRVPRKEDYTHIPAHGKRKPDLPDLPNLPELPHVPHLPDLFRPPAEKSGIENPRSFRLKVGIGTVSTQFAACALRDGPENGGRGNVKRWKIKTQKCVKGIDFCFIKSYNLSLCSLILSTASEYGFSP